jgi:hypothetical protein
VIQAGIAQEECSQAQAGLCWPAVCRGCVGKRSEFGSCLGMVLRRIWLRVWLCAGPRLWLLTLALPLILSTEIIYGAAFYRPGRLWLARLGMGRALGLAAMVGPGRPGLAYPSADCGSARGEPRAMHQPICAPTYANNLQAIFCRLRRLPFPWRARLDFCAATAIPRRQRLTAPDRLGLVQL